MENRYAILAKNRDNKAWYSYQTDSFIEALFVIIKRNFTHEIVDITFRNFKG